MPYLDPTAVRGLTDARVPVFPVPHTGPATTRTGTRRPLTRPSRQEPADTDHDCRSERSQRTGPAGLQTGSASSTPDPRPLAPALGDRSPAPPAWNQPTPTTTAGPNGPSAPGQLVCRRAQPPPHRTRDHSHRHSATAHPPLPPGTSRHRPRLPVRTVPAHQASWFADGLSLLHTGPATTRTGTRRPLTRPSRLEPADTDHDCRSERSRCEPGNRRVWGAPGGTRTHTERCLRPRPLPLGYGGLHAHARIRAARPSTASSIGSVSLPVNVFCCDGW